MKPCQNDFSISNEMFNDSTILLQWQSNDTIENLWQLCVSKNSILFDSLEMQDSFGILIDTLIQESYFLLNNIIPDHTYFAYLRKYCDTNIYSDWQTNGY